ncbi:hypothetical protein [Corynebacterium afermentans]|nr:hypothetical protein [Corynebacterium afermentans]MDC7107852.1 hypothetical protein [Corynebacterium afermentans]
MNEQQLEKLRSYYDNTDTSDLMEDAQPGDLGNVGDPEASVACTVTMPNRVLRTARGMAAASRCLMSWTIVDFWIMSRLEWSAELRTKCFKTSLRKSPMQKGAAKMRYSYKEIKSLDGLRLKRPPHQGEIAAAHLVIKQINEGKRPGEEITPFLRWVADYGSPGFQVAPVVIENPNS